MTAVSPIDNEVQIDTGPTIVKVDTDALGYETVTRVYASSARKKILGTHKYVCESLVDDRELGPQFR